MTDPYDLLATELRAAAARRSGGGTANGRVRAWLSHRTRAGVVAALLALGGGAGAVAATGLLQGAPVKPEVAPVATAGNGLPVGAEKLSILAADPSGGLPWGLRVLHTTRGQTCVQVGRVEGSELGELGLDSAFGDDGRFHPLPASVLPPGYGGSQGQVECVTSGQTTTVVDLNADRSGVRLLPQEFTGPPGATPKLPPKSDLRALAYGLLGPHAVSVTYATPSGPHTIAVTGRDGAFLIVQPAFIPSTDTVGGSDSGEATASSVNAIGPVGRSTALILAATFRFGTRICSEGTGGPLHPACPLNRSRPVPAHVQTRRLHQPVRLVLLAQPRAVCDAAYLKFPCYRGRVEFTAPYTVSSASSDYSIQGVSRCKIGGRPETSWNLERDVRAHQKVQTDSLGLFVYTPSCARNERFEVQYLGRAGLAGARDGRVILGSVALSEAVLADGAKPGR